MSPESSLAFTWPSREATSSLLDFNSASGALPNESLTRVSLSATGTPPPVGRWANVFEGRDDEYDELIDGEVSTTITRIALVTHAEKVTARCRGLHEVLEDICEWGRLAKCLSVAHQTDQLKMREVPACARGDTERGSA